MKKILVASGTSTNRMNLVANVIRRLCNEHGFQVEVKAQNLWDVDVDQEAPDVIVVIGPEKKLSTTIPIVNGIPFLTRLGIDKVLEEIMKYLR